MSASKNWATGLTLRYGTPFRLDCGGRLTGVALLLPPQVRDFPLSAVIAAVLSTLKLWRPRALSRGVASSVEAHRPTFPCWTLVSLGIKPADQHRGHGSSLLAHVLRWCRGEVPYVWRRTTGAICRVSQVRSQCHERVCRTQRQGPEDVCHAAVPSAWLSLLRRRVKQFNG